jgi:TM2 domain-containing membrane protein YozV
MFCSSCGTQASDTDQTCSNCGRALAAAPVPAPYAVAQPQQVILVKSGKNSGLAAVLSFFWCGLGQIYNGQLGKGLIVGFVYFLSVLAMALLIGFITTPILWIWGMYDAYQTAERLNREQGLA